MKHNLKFAAVVATLVLFSTNLIAGDPDFVKLPDNRQFLIIAGAGYGFSNNPCSNCDDKSWIGGTTFSMALGYRVNEKFTLEFGPSFWIEGKDIINKNVADSERPNNKRTLVTFGTTYTPSSKIPLEIRLGAGVGTLNYTPPRTTVNIGEKQFQETEIFKGFSGTLGVSYEIRLCDKLKMQPAVNVWYIQFQEPAIPYNSYINYQQSSLTAEARLNFRFRF